MMAVTTPGVAVDSQNDESNGANKNNSVRGADVPATSPLEGESLPPTGSGVGAAQQRREGGKPQGPALAATPLPGPPPQGGREQESRARGNNDPRDQGGNQRQPRRDKHDVHGWVVLDKPIGMTSTHAVAIVKRLFSAKRAGPAAILRHQDRRRARLRPGARRRNRCIAAPAGRNPLLIPGRTTG